MNTIRVVLIEDHELTRVGIRVALQQSKGFEVIGEAGNAIEGLKLLEVTQPDVAIVDIDLPDINGIELTQRLKASLTALGPQKTKVLILTLHEQQEMVLAAFAAKADSYCLKDATIEHLLEALRVTHAGYSWIDPAIARIVLQHSQAMQMKASATTTNKTVFINPADSDHNQLIEAYPLTKRELELMELIVQGYPNAEIARQLHITVGTVKTHVRNILNKLCVDDRTQAAVRALRCGIVR